MHPNFRPPRGLVVFLLVFLLTSFALAVDKKRKPPVPEAASKTKAKAAQKADPKQPAKVVRASDKNSNKQQIAQQKKKDGNEKQSKKRGQEVAAKQREEKADNKQAHNTQAKAKTAKHAADKKADKKEVVAKKSPPAKSSAKAATKTELAAAQPNLGSRTTKQAAQREIAARTEEHKTATRDTAKSLAKLERKAKSDSKPEPLYQTKVEPVKELPATKFTLRPIAKVMPKVELKFSVARALATTSFDAPPPRDNGPDVIDVIEHDSPEAKRLDDVLRSEMKSLQVSGVPSNSRRKIDLGKMDAERIKQIQEALAKKGYYAGEITGQYDDATSEAMRKFQTEHKIDVTGYATAQSLRLLGLTDW